MAFKARLNFSGRNSYGLSCSYVSDHHIFPLKNKGFACVLLFLIWGCGPARSDKQEIKIDARDLVAVIDSATSKATEPSPPESFILDLKTSANTIVLVQLSKVHTVTGTTKIFSGKVLKNYKGTISKGSIISYAGMSEKKYEDNVIDTVVVFLTKHQKPLPNLNYKNVYYSTVEENAMIEPYLSLDSLLNP